MYYRWISAINGLAIWFQILYFMKLNDKIYPFVFMMFSVVYEIGSHFFIVLGIIIFAFSNAYWLIIKNVMTFDKIPGPDGDEDGYEGDRYQFPFWYSLMVGYYFVLGEVGEYQ